MLTNSSPTTADTWWSCSETRWSSISEKNKFRIHNAGLAQEQGTLRVPACEYCVRKGYQADCKALEGKRCGRCINDGRLAREGCVPL